MNSGLTPKYTSPLNKETFSVWFQTTNTYVFLDNAFKELLELYFECDNKSAFLINTEKQLGINKELAESYFTELSNFLQECNTTKEKPQIQNIKSPIDTEKKITKYYSLDALTIAISYSSKKIMDFIHYQIAHLCHVTLDKCDYTIDITEDSSYFYLYLNTIYIEGFLKKEYHLLQGKLALIILNLIYDKSENDWLGMFHASTVCKEDAAIMFVGTSGSGKSTFTSLLVANGYDLVADDITPILSNNLNAYFTPNAISIKEGAYSVIEPYYKNFNSFPEFTFSTKKGNSKLITSNKSFKKNSVSCNTIILVKYVAGSETILTKVDPKKVLQTLIPDSWISPLEANAKLFLKWIQNLNYFELTYSNNKDAINQVNSLLS